MLRAFLMQKVLQILTFFVMRNGMPLSNLFILRKTHKFMNGFLKMKQPHERMKESMIASVQESAGLGSPPIKYSTNRSEYMNTMLQNHTTNYHKRSWVELTNNMYTLIIGASLSEPHQMLQRFQINALQHRRRTGCHSNVSAMGNGI